MHTLSRHELFFPSIRQLPLRAERCTRPGRIERLTFAMVVIGIVIGAAGIARALIAG